MFALHTREREVSYPVLRPCTRERRLYVRSSTYNTLYTQCLQDYIRTILSLEEGECIYPGGGQAADERSSLLPQRLLLPLLIGLAAASAATGATTANRRCRGSCRRRG